MKQHPEDDPLITLDWCLGLLLCVLSLIWAVGLGAFLGSVLLHTWHTELRHTLLWAWQQLQALYWAWATVNF